MTREDSHELISEMGSLQSSVEIWSDRIKAAVEGSLHKIRDVEIKVEKNLQSAVNLQNKSKE